MAVPTSAADLSTTASSNSPSGSDSIGTSLDDYMRAFQAILKQENSKGSDIASATSPTIPSAGKYFVVTGTTTITSFADSWVGRTVYLKFSGALTLTHSSGLILPGAANITTVAGDVLGINNESAGVWRVCFYQRASGLPVVYSSSVLVQIVSSAVTPASNTTTIPSDDSVPTITEGSEVWTLPITPTSASNKVRVNGSINIGGTASMFVAVALFRGSTCIWAASQQVPNAVSLEPLPINVLDAPATTSATTYSVRVGAVDGAGTWTVSDSLTARFGTAAAGSTIELMEVVA